MTRIDVKPFRTLPESTDAVVALPPECAGLPWDMDTTLTVSQRVVVDVDAVRERCGLSADACVAVVHTVRCDATYWTAEVIAPLPMLGSGDMTVDVEVPARTVAKALRHYVSVVLSDNTDEGVARSAVAMGSVLWTGPLRTTRLEGSANQFPTDVVSFARTGRNANARWTLEYDYDSVDAPVLGALRLLLNADAPAVKVILDRERSGSDPELVAFLGAELRRFVITDVIRQAVTDDRFEDGRDAPEDSVGTLVRSMLDRYAHASLDELRSLSVVDRARFEQLLQSVVVDVTA